MTHFQTFSDDTVVPVSITQEPEGLSSIRRKNCAATIWNRIPLPRFQSWIDNLAPEQLPRARMLLPTERVRDALTELMQFCGTPPSPERDMLADDVAALAAVFAKIMRVPYLRLRLDVITSNSCRKFHIDPVTAQLVCTYRGTGIKYGVSTNGSDPDKVLIVPTCAPIVMRGTNWPEHPKSGFLHQSPAVEGTGETRLVLKLDPVTEDGSQPEPSHSTLH